MASKRKKLAPSNRPSLFAAEDDADESHHDPYSDVDCEFGSDTNYDPDGVQESESRILKRAVTVRPKKAHRMNQRKEIGTFIGAHRSLQFSPLKKSYTGKIKMEKFARHAP
ncbi:uncharacterized protein LOC135118718 [Helicoverpa armigera]|uniref:uncharacterized protein LOC135118718 n=1 Tax=Helicoverpa armigera TaxID=29058 RepID=UPI003083C69E